MDKPFIIIIIMCNSNYKRARAHSQQLHALNQNYLYNSIIIHNYNYCYKNYIATYRYSLMHARGLCVILKLIRICTHVLRKQKLYIELLYNIV